MAHPLVRRDLQAMVGRGLGGLQIQHRGQLADIIGTPRVLIGGGGGCSGSPGVIVHVELQGQVMGERTDVRNHHARVSRQLALHRHVELVGKRRLEAQTLSRLVEGAEDCRGRIAARLVDVGERRGSGRKGGRAPVRQLRAIDIGERCDGKPGLAQRERSEVGGCIPLVPGDGAIEDAAGSTNRGLPVAERVIRQTEARRDVVKAYPRNSPGYPGIARKQHPGGSTRKDRRSATGNEGRLAVQAIVGGWRLEVVPHPKIQGKLRRRAIVILEEKSVVPTVRNRLDIGVLLHAGGVAGEKVGERVFGRLRG